jgi:hypothetical protein
MDNTIEFKQIRKTDPFLDRRSGDDRRQAYDLDYFQTGKEERRRRQERRQADERRKGCVRVSQWTSVCPDSE